MFSKDKKRRTLEYFIEFVLVVLGISIAFWLGERAEQSKKNKLEVQYLEGFLEDLTSDLGVIEYLAMLNQNRADLLKEAVDFFQGSPNHLTIDSIPPYAVEITNIDFFYPNDFTYVSVQQGGDFKIIKNHEIRNLLVKLYSSYESVDREQTSLIASLNDNFFPKFFENYKLASGHVINRDYFNSAHLSNYIIFTRDQINVILVYFERSKNLAEQTIALIQQELE